jgi:hypothetical protein
MQLVSLEVLARDLVKDGSAYNLCSQVNEHVVAKWRFKSLLATELHESSGTGDVFRPRLH